MSENQDKVQKLVGSFGTWYEDRAWLAKGAMTKGLWPYEKMFSPIRVNRLTIKNRLVMAPMGNIDMAEETGRPNAKMIEYFTARAKGGCGLITSGLVPISHGVDPTVTELGELSYFPRIDRSRTVYSGWRDIAERCHAYGARFFIQLTAGLGRVGSPECLLNKKRLPVSASWNGNFYMPVLPCRPLTDAQARRIDQECGPGGRRRQGRDHRRRLSPRPRGLPPRADDQSRLQQAQAGRLRRLARVRPRYGARDTRPGRAGLPIMYSSTSPSSSGRPTGSAWSR